MVNITGLSVGGSLDAESISAAAVTGTGRRLGGVVLEYGKYGLTSKGRLKVAPGALKWPADLGVVKFTREHDRENVRGYIDSVVDDGQRLRISAAVSDGPEGDEAIREAKARLREGLSFDIVDATVVGDTITAGRVVAIGQVGVPAYDDGRIDQIAANLTTEGNTMTEEQRARLAELAVATSRTTEEEAEMVALLGLLTGTSGTTEEETPPVTASAEPEQVTASANAPAPRRAVPSGIPTPERAPARTERPAGQAFAEFVSTFTNALRTRLAGDNTQITAALADITHSQHTTQIEQPAWSGELWSGLLYEAEFADLFTRGPLTNWSGQGWRFTKKLAIQDYAGNKTAIPTDTVTTEAAGYESARMAVGVDIDRKFYDFPNEGFVTSLWEQVRESWAMQLDGKVRAYTLANATSALNDEANLASGPYAASPSLIKAAAVARRALKRRRVGAASWIYVNDEDLFSLLDIDQNSLPVFLDLWGIDPRDFRSSEQIPSGTVLAGVKQAATVRELPGSPVRVDAQHIANGGVDSGFFGYWAIEEHHTRGIAKATFTPPA